MFQATAAGLSAASGGRNSRRALMDLQFGGRRALVTGSTGGIGYAIAQGLAPEGAAVLLTGRTQASVDAALARLRQALPQLRVAALRPTAPRPRARSRCSRRCRKSTSSSTTSASTRASRPSRSPTRNGALLRGQRAQRACASRATTRRRWPGAAGAGSSSCRANPALNIPREMIHYGMTKTAQLASRAAWRWSSPAPA